MKKLLMLSVAAIALAAASPAFAEHDGAPYAGKINRAKVMFDEADTNDDGVLSKEEFLARHEAKFKEIDANSDGSISKEEMEARRAEWKKKHDEMKAAQEAAPAEAPAEEVAPTEGAE